MIQNRELENLEDRLTNVQNYNKFSSKANDIVSGIKELGSSLVHYAKKPLLGLTMLATLATPIAADEMSREQRLDRNQVLTCENTERYEQAINRGIDYFKNFGFNVDVMWAILESAKETGNYIDTYNSLTEALGSREEDGVTLLSRDVEEHFLSKGGIGFLFKVGDSYVVKKTNNGFKTAALIYKSITDITFNIEKYEKIYNFFLKKYEKLTKYISN